MEKENIKRTFTLKLNGLTVCDIEASGSTEIVDAFVKKTLTDSFGLFYKWNDTIVKIFLGEMEVTMHTIFRDKKGKYVKPDIKVEKK